MMTIYNLMLETNILSNVTIQIKKKLNLAFSKTFKDSLKFTIALLII